MGFVKICKITHYCVCLAGCWLICGGVLSRLQINYLWLRLGNDLHFFAELDWMLKPEVHINARRIAIPFVGVGPAARLAVQAGFGVVNNVDAPVLHLGIADLHPMR